MGWEHFRRYIIFAKGRREDSALGNMVKASFGGNSYKTLGGNSEAQNEHLNHPPWCPFQFLKQGRGKFDSH